MKITGVMIYYYFICQKKLWYFLQEINMEQNSELVEMGKIIDETSYSRKEKNLLIDNTINIDYRQDKTILHEVKKTKAIEEAGIWQVKYYMYYLEKRGVSNIVAQIDYPLLRETKQVILEKGDKDILENVIQNIEELKNNNIPNRKEDTKICKKCAYYDLCYI